MFDSAGKSHPAPRFKTRACAIGGPSRSEVAKMADAGADTRRELADALENVILKAAADVRAQQQELRRKFPKMSALPPPLDVDPELISDFTESRAYEQAVQDYIRGRTAENLVVTVLRLLRDLAPPVFGGI